MSDVGSGDVEGSGWEEFKEGEGLGVIDDVEASRASWWVYEGSGEDGGRGE